MALSSSIEAYSTASYSASASLFTTSMPLTTVFTPPASCSDRPFTYWTDDGTTSTFWRDIYIEDTDCYPYSYSFQHDPRVSAVYSPGVCPGAYYAAQYTANGPTGAQTSWCCPSGMTYGNYACQSLATRHTVAISGESTVSVTDPFIAADWYIQVAWAATELDSFTPASAPVLTTTSTSASSITASPTRIAIGESGPTKATQASGSATATGTSSEQSSGLSTGAKAGIGVGVALGALAVIGVIAFFLLRKKRKSKWSSAPPGDHNADTAYGQETKYAYLRNQTAEIHEAGDTSRPLAEMYGDARPPAELSGRGYTAELDGGPVRGRDGAGKTTYR